MSSPSLHFIRYGLSVAPIFLLSGCWEKIEYTGSSANVRPGVAPTAAIEDQTPAKVNDFASPASNAAGNETPVVSSATTTESPPTSAISSTPTTPSARSDPADDDRYALPAEETDSTSTAPSMPVEPPVATEHPQPVSRHTDATAVSATLDVPPPPAAPNTRRAAWLLGSQLSLAALANDRRMAANNVPIWFDEARSAGRLLGASPADLPEPPPANDSGSASKRVIDYLLIEGQRIGPEIAKHYGADHASLLEVALKSNLLILLYTPGGNDANSIAAAISRAGPQAELPAALWRPLVDLIASQAPLSDVRAAVRQMHSDVDRYLANAAEPTGR
jgi:hypothetical protein